MSSVPAVKASGLLGHCFYLRKASGLGEREGSYFGEEGQWLL